MNKSFRDLFFDPNTFFRNMMNEKEDFKIPALILFLGGIISAIYGYYASMPTVRMMGSLMPGMETIILISAVVVPFIGIFIIWVVWAGIIHIISSLLQGKGAFNRTLECIGYGFIPQIAGSLITLLLAFEYIPNVRVPDISVTSDPEVISKAVNALMQDPAMHELTTISSVLSILFLLWSANIWIFGIRNARGLSLRNSVLSVGIPVALLIAYTIYSLKVV
jgi:hypothetical protein